MAINEELLDQLIAGCQKPEDLLGENGLLKQLTKRLIERAMQAEMTDRLGNSKNDSSGKNTGNSRNGTSKKKIQITLSGPDHYFKEMDNAYQGIENSFEPVLRYI